MGKNSVLYLAKRSPAKSGINSVPIIVGISCILYLIGGLIFAQDKSPGTSLKQHRRPASDRKRVKEEDVIVLNHGEKVYIKEKKIEIKGYIVNPNMPLELLACTKGGKDYESLVVMECRPQNIHLALLLFGLKEGKGPKDFGDPTRPTGDLALVFIEWEKDGRVVSYRAEDLIIDVRTKKPMDRVGWSFTGSEFIDERDFDTGKPTGRKIYLANCTKTIIATYHDPSAILDNPTEGGGIGNIYQPNKELVPERGTEVKVIIRAPNKKELKELKKINKKVAEQEKAEWEKREKEEKEEKQGE